MGNDLGYLPQTSKNFKDPITVSWANQTMDNITALHSFFANYRQGVSLVRNTGLGCASIIIGTGTLMINGKLRQNTGTWTATWADNLQTGLAEATSTAYYVWAIASGNTSVFDVRWNLTGGGYTGETYVRLLGKLYNDNSGNISYVSRTPENLPATCEGYYLGDGAVIQTIQLGWQPTYASVETPDHQNRYERTDSMTGGSSTRLAAATFETILSAIVAFDVTGFNVSTSVNAANTKYFFRAIKEN